MHAFSASVTRKDSKWKWQRKNQLASGAADYVAVAASPQCQPVVNRRLRSPPRTKRSMSRSVAAGIASRHTEGLSRLRR